MNHSRAKLPSGTRSYLLLLSLALTGCGGEAETGTDSNDGLVEQGRPVTQYRLEGAIRAQPNIGVDGDINDPEAPYFNNDGGESGNVQPLPGRVLLNGFVTAEPTGVAGDRFEARPDENDAFHAALEQGQFVSLRNPGFAVSDCDLYLYRASDMALVASSTSAGEFDSVSVPAGDEYVIVVNAVRASSTYLLSIDTTSMISGVARYGQKADFEPDTAIVQLSHNDGNADMSVATALENRLQVNLSHRDLHRAALARFNRINPQTRAALQLQGSKSEFEGWLARRNPFAHDKLETLRAIKSLTDEKGIVNAEPNYRMLIQQISGDPSFGYQWYLPAVGMAQAWDVTRGASDVIVAVVDTGIHSAHPELHGQLVPGYDFIADIGISRDGDGLDPDPEDPGDSDIVGESSWHGTHVAGIIAALDNNGEGIAGAAPGVKVMPLRAVGFGGADSYDVMQAVRYAAGLDNDSGTVPSRPADIVNLSLGGGSYSESSQQLFEELYDLGVITVAAGGNEATTEPFYPAAYNQVLSVGATDLDGDPAPYTNFGQFIDLAAPGGDLAQDRDTDGHPDGMLSLSVAENVDTGRSPSYVFSHGTSAAAPVAASILALMKSVYPDLSQADVFGLLRSGALTGNDAHSGPLGYGVINAPRAVEAALNLNAGVATTSLVANPGDLQIGSLQNHRDFSIGLTGDDTLAVDRIIPSAGWLSVTAVNIDGNGLGEYAVLVDRSGLAAGTYQAQLDLHASDGSMVLLDVSVEVAAAETPGNAGPITIGLFDSTSLNPVEVLRVEAQEGLYHYAFERVPAGNYYVVAGADIDNNSKLCNPAESCGAYPALLNPAAIALFDHIDDADFSLEAAAPSGTPVISIDGNSVDPAPAGALDDNGE